MAYVAGDTITTSEYNGLLTNTTSSGTPPAFGINHILGTGALQYGLGQTALSSVGITDNIQAAQWNSLFTSMNNVALHAGVTLTSTTAKSAGDTIQIISALTTDLNKLAAAVASGCESAANGGPAGATGTANLTTSAALLTTASSAAAGTPARWNDYHAVEHVFTFASANAARHYFNAGGKLRINVTRTAGGSSTASTTSKDSSVDELITGLGDFKLGAQISTQSGSGETLDSSGALTQGFYDLTTDYQTICIITQNNGVYSGYMNIKIEAKANAIVSGGTATVVTIKTTIADPTLGDSTHDDAWTSGNTNSVDQYANFIGVTNVVCRTLTPTTTNLSTAIAAPSATLGSNTVVV
jgi:hypothetical protein